MREVKQHFRNKDCIVVFRDHVIRKRAGSRNAEVWIRDNELEVVWDDFKPEATAADKKKLAVKKKRMNVLLGKASTVQESSTDGEDDEYKEDREQREKIEAFKNYWDDTESEGEDHNNGNGGHNSEAHDEAGEDREGQREEEDQHDKDHNFSEGTEDGMHVDTIEVEMSNHENDDNDSDEVKII